VARLLEGKQGVLRILEEKEHRCIGSNKSDARAQAVRKYRKIIGEIEGRREVSGRDKLPDSGVNSNRQEGVDFFAHTTKNPQDLP